MSETVCIGTREYPLYRYNTVVVGSGAAGLNCISFIRRRGQKSVALVTEGMKMGTSRNTGSDKQTYYKLSTCGDQEDSVRRMAATLFDGGAMDGDIALAEAAASAQCFFRLVEAGVPFPHNACGEFVGYKTDHDPCKRGTSAGPLTSKFMTECLAQDVEMLGIRVFDKYQVVEILTDGEGDDKRACGLLALDLSSLDETPRRYAVFSAVNVVYATGGEAGMYETSVYPVSQTGSTGVALRAGARGKNLTESQYGLASIRFRWNLSGTYQQVLPRYFSTDKDGGDESEFLDEHFDNPEKLLTAIFLKGYQWPFDPRKVENQGSSLIDIAVYHETMNKGRRVFLDYTRNPSCVDANGTMDFDRVVGEAKEYLVNSQALLPTPIERLHKMNPAAIKLYMDHHIVLASEPLEIAVCAQHNNGGLAADKWWQSNIRRLFPIGEVNGTHGVYRPGGSALNSGQVGGVRAGEYIVKKCQGEAAAHLPESALRQAATAVAFGDRALERGQFDLDGEIAVLRRRMSETAAHIRSASGISRALAEAGPQLDRLHEEAGIAEPSQLPQLYKAVDLAVCQFVYLSAIQDFIVTGGGSRGSYLVQDLSGIKPGGLLPDAFTFRLDDGSRAAKIQEILFDGRNCHLFWRDARPVPAIDDWFENVWKEYREGEIFSK